MVTATGTRFVVLTSQRSGSAWLISLLNSFEGTTAYSELFLDRTRDPAEDAWDSEFARPRFYESAADIPLVRPFSVFAYLDDVYSAPGTLGFKFMYSQLRKYPEVMIYLMRRRIRVIHLVRQNHLDVVISRATKTITGEPHPVSGQPGNTATIQVSLDIETLLNQLSKLRKQIKLVRQVLRWCQLPHIEVTYEALIKDPSQFNSIWAFLAIEARGAEQPETNLVKIRKKRHSEVISNYNEVKRILTNTDFAELLT